MIVAGIRSRKAKRAVPKRHKTKAEYAEHMREAALCNLRIASEMPDADTEELRATSGALLEMVGDMLADIPRCGWYPNKPRNKSHLTRL